MKLVESIKYPQLLTEEKINSFCRLQFPKFSLDDIINILKHCSDWNMGSDDGIFEYTPEDSELEMFDKVIQNASNFNDIELKYSVTARFDITDIVKYLQKYHGDISTNDMFKLFELAVKKQKYKDFILESPGVATFKGSSVVALDFYQHEYCPILKGNDTKNFFQLAHYQEGTPIVIHGRLGTIGILIFNASGTMAAKDIDKFIQPHFEFTHPLTPKMKWMLNVGYKTLGPQAGKAQVQDDYTLDKMPDKSKPETMKSKSGKPLKNGDMIRVKGETFKYETDQYFMVGINKDANKQNQIPLEIRDGKFYGFDQNTKSFSTEVEHSPSDIPQENILKKSPQKGNPKDKNGKKIQNQTVLFKQDGTPFEPGEVFVISGKNDFIYMPDPDPHFDTPKQLTDYFDTSDVMDRIQTFERIRRAELKQLSTVKQTIIDKASEEDWSKEKLKKELAEAEKKTKDEWKIGFELENVKSFNEIKKYIKTAEDILKDLQKNGEDIDEEDPYGKVIESDPSYGNACAKRREKLFTAAQKRGATVIKTAKWTAAVCKKVSEVAVFGRLKPKVIPGTNDIDPNCNLEDWEKITPENKAKRDDKECINTKIVKDNIDDGYGHSFNQLDGNQYAKYAKYAETEWCVCGAESDQVQWSTQGATGFWNTYTNDGMHAMVALMDNTRGALYLYSKYTLSKKVVIDFLNENECIDGYGHDGDRSHTAQTKFFQDKCKAEPELDDLMRRIDHIYYPEFQPVDAKQTEKTLKKLIIEPKEKLEHACATRRLKLFKAAEHEGAEVHQTAAWVYAICYTPAQVHPFGRNKPVVIPGTNEIDPLCNMEDWEKIDGKGITPENKAKRDDKSKTYPRIKDGILTETGKNLDEHYYYTGQDKHGIYNAEANWCVCGTLGGHYQWPMGSFVQYGLGMYFSDTHPLIVFMETKTGRMYLYCNLSVEEFKNELDLIDTNSAVSATQWLYGEFYKTHPEFAVLHAQLVKKYFNKNIQNQNAAQAVVTDPEELMKIAKTDGKIQSNGFLKLNSEAEAKKFQPIFGKFSGITVDTQNAAGMFKGLDLGTIEIIDMYSVTNASGMFEDAKLGMVRFVNARHVTDMNMMFHAAQLAGISELDTGRVETMQGFMQDAKTEKNAMLQIPTLNLENCLDISHAFQGTNVQKINILNAKKVRNAQDAYYDCPFLASYPETCFPEVHGINRLTSGEAYEDIFEGCTTLMSAGRRRKIMGQTPEDEQKKNGMYDQEVAKIEPGLSKYELDDRKIKLSKKIRGEYAFDFMQMLKHTQDYYEQNAGTANKIKIDDNDMIVVCTPEEVRDALPQMRKHAGIKVGVEDASGMFSNINDIPLYIRTLDISGVRNANQMFYGSNIQLLDNVIGTETVKYAIGMFKEAKLGFTPAMNFKSACSVNEIFCDTDLKELPKNVKFNFKTITDGNATSPNIVGSYIFGDDYAEADATKRIGKSRMDTWLSKMIYGAVAEEYANDKLEIDENGFMLIDYCQNIADLLAAFNEVNDKREQLGLKKIVGFKLHADDESEDLAGNEPVFSSLDMPQLDMPPIDVSNRVSTDALFASSNIKSVKTIIGLEKIASAKNMFQSAHIGELPAEMDFSNIYNASSMFYEFNVDKKIKLENLKFSDKLEYAIAMFEKSDMFEGALTLHDGLQFFKNIKKANQMFYFCKAPIKIEKLTMQAVNDATEMFSRSGLETIKELAMPHVENIEQMFYGNEKLVKVGKITASADICSQMFTYCQNLQQIIHLQLDNALDVHGIFNATPKLASIPFLMINPNVEKSDGAFHASLLEPVYGKDLQIYKIVMKNLKGVN